jgi:hypothetical protein
MTDITNPKDPKDSKKSTNSEGLSGSDSGVRMLPETLGEVASVDDTSITVRTSNSTKVLTVKVPDSSGFEPGDLVRFSGLELHEGGLVLGGSGVLVGGTSTGIAPIEGTDVGRAAPQPKNITGESFRVDNIPPVLSHNFDGRVINDLYRHLVKVSKIDKERYEMEMEQYTANH